MATEISSLARPYAEAVFAHAAEKGNLQLWSEMLELMAFAVKDENLQKLIGNPAVTRDNLSELLLEVGGGRLNDEGQNLIKLLVANDRVSVLPEIATQFEALKNDNEGAIEVLITSAFELKPAQESSITAALKKKFNKEISVSSRTDDSLIGGIHIKVGDLVIDGSIKGQLQQLANELGI